VWAKVCACHRRVTGSKSEPSKRRWLFRHMGLESVLKPARRGRRRKN
jgi:hypothetical protein